MSIIVKAPEKTAIAQLPAGNYQGVCYMVRDIGTHSFEWQGEVKRQHQVIILYEVDELITEGKFEGKRYVVSEKVTLSLHEKAKLRQRIEGWFGRELSEDELDGFDLESLIGMNGMINIITNAKGYPVVNSVSPLPKKMEKILPENVEAPGWVEKLWFESEEYKDTHKEEDMDPLVADALAIFGDSDGTQNQK